MEKPDNRAPACPICATTLAAQPSATGEPTPAVCDLCGTAAVLLPDGSVLTEADWQHRVTKEGGQPPIESVSPASAPAPSPATVPLVPRAPRPIRARPPHPSPAHPPTPAAHLEAAVPQTRTSAPPVETVAMPEASTTTAPLDARAFQGSLANLSVIDVLQLLYSSRKSGLLRLTGQGNTATIALKDGHVIGGGNPARGRFIGQILVEQGVVTQAQVDAALVAQREDSGPHRPLVAILAAQGHLTEEVGWRALAKLIEEIIIDVLHWGSGEFVFEAGLISPTDGFRHLADGVMEGIGLDTQSTLLEALRAIDEGAPKTVSSEDVIDLDAAFTAMATTPAGPLPSVSLPEERTPPPGQDAVDAPQTASRWQPLRVRVRVAAQIAGARLRRLPRTTRIAAAVVTALLLLVVVILLATTGGEPQPPSAAITAEPVPLEPAPVAARPELEPVATTPAAVAEEDSQPDLPDEPPSKKPAGKRKGRKLKAKDARSLFDAALAPDK